MAAAAPARVVETHSAVLLCAGDRVYKAKKPVDLGFLDFSTLERRRLACEREVALNRRLSPDVYLGVHDLVDPDGAVVEHVVVMRRMPEDRALSALVRSGADVDEHLRRLARLVAGFHATARTSPEIADAGSVDSVRRNWQEGLDQLAGFVGPVLDEGTYERLRRLALRYLAGRAPLLAARQREGRVRDGHGDLLAADVFCLDDGPRVLDCIDFDDRLRWGDVLLDVAFLAMDLADLGRPDLGEAFLAAYEEFSGQSQPASLTQHYTAYRAQVRSKVACLRWAQGDAASCGHARSLAGLAVERLERAAVRLVLVGGLPGTGKSTVAAGLADARGWALLRSDVLRKQRAGLALDERTAAGFDEGLYAPDVTAAVYADLLGHARQALGMGESVVLDASWSDPAQRAAARAVAEQTSSDLVELRCALPAGLAARRLQERAARGGDPSDADPATAQRMAERFAPWPEAVVLDAQQPPARVLAQAQAAADPLPG